MGDYAVTITSATTTRPSVDLESLIDALPADAAISFRLDDCEISATFYVMADDVHAAADRGHRTFSSAMRTVGFKDYADTEVHALAWEAHARAAETSTVPDIVSAPEVAEILGVSRQRVHQLINDHTSFPTPIIRLGSGPLWLRATIEAFNESWVRKPGRPRVAS